MYIFLFTNRNIYGYVLRIYSYELIISNKIFTTL